jgi:two-component system cell cycle sensor histidine kinase/response regulator CckA
MGRILLVGDGAEARRAALALGRAEHEIDRVDSVAAAQARLGAGRFDLVLMTPAALASSGGRADAEVLRETFDVFEDGVCLLGRDGRLEVANAIGQRLHDGGLRGDLEGVAREAIDRGVTADRNLTLDGRAFAVRAYPLSGRGAVLYVRDATDERQQELGRLQAEKLGWIGLLAAGVAHEINNPSAFVLGNIEALSGHLHLIEDKLRELPESALRSLGLTDVLFEASAILQESKEGMARIHRIVRDLGSFSHADDDATVSMNVNPALESALTMLRNELKYRARVERDLRATRLVRASPPRLGQVFLNLLLNAAQALDEGGAKRNVVTVRSFDDGDSVVIEVADNGPGIPPEVLPRIFESFFTTKPRGLGTGLGLPISLGIVRGLGGELTVEAPPGTGARFRVRLPASETVAEPAPVVPAEPEPVAAPTRRRILAVDDEALLLKAYRRMLGDAHELATALGGHEALRTLERDTGFDVVLCDLQMPEMSGMELHAAVRATHPALAERFVFVTGGAFSSDARRFMEEAVSAVIQKPFRVEDLLALIERIAGGAGGRRPSGPHQPLSRAT